MANPKCSVPDCDKPTRSGKALLCAMHYHRQYRHGDVNKTARDTRVTASGGRRYRWLYLPNHPLSHVGGRVYEHRAVLYDVIGAGPHPCHWCAASVDWLPHGEEGELQVDHLNGIGDDNRPANLVPACRPCNSRRAQQAKSDALRDAGWWSLNDTIASLRPGRSRRRSSPVVPALQQKRRSEA